jgi:hypothetical protein
MTNCQNETMRDLLPLLAHDALEGEEASAVRAHMESCAECTSELRAITAAAALFDAATPRIDTAAILAKLPAAPRARPALRLEPAARKSRPAFGLPRYALAAAASLMLMVTLSLTVLRPIFFGGAPAVDIVAVDSGTVDTAPEPVAAVALASVGGTELRDLGVDELTQLLNELDQMEATIAAEPRSMREPITTDSEGL